MVFCKKYFEQKIPRFNFLFCFVFRDMESCGPKYKSLLLQPLHNCWMLFSGFRAKEELPGQTRSVALTVCLPTIHSGKVASALFQRRHSRRSDAGCELRLALLTSASTAGSREAGSNFHCFQPVSSFTSLGAFSCHHPAGPTPVLSRVTQGLILFLEHSPGNSRQSGSQS